MAANATKPNPLGSTTLATRSSSAEASVVAIRIAIIGEIMLRE